MSDLSSLVFDALTTLRRFEPREGYFLAFSGGKDSICCLKLLELSGCKFEAHYSVTTLDNPEVAKFIHKFYPTVQFDHPGTSMFKLIPKKSLPTRRHRWCCQFLKEYSGVRRLVITGIRSAESYRRSLRSKFELDNRRTMGGKAYLNLIFDWSSDHVFEFLKFSKAMIPDYYYSCATSRGGCIGCPMQGSKGMLRDFALYPRFKSAYLIAIQKGITAGRFSKFENSMDVFNWWTSGLSFEKYQDLKNQLKINF